MSKRRYAVGFACTLLLTGCAGLKQGIDDCQTVTAEVKAEFGTDAGCSFQSMNGHTTVTVRFLTVPAGDASVLKTKVTAIAHRSFHSRVDAVVLAL